MPVTVMVAVGRMQAYLSPRGGDMTNLRCATIVAAILSCVFVGEAKADFTSGNDLWDACQADEAKDPIRATFCLSYIVGAGETFQVLQVAKAVSFYCIPDKVKNGQAIDVVKLYLRDHPETRRYSAPTLIMCGMRRFPPPWTVEKIPG
jgi:hypothetical protein